MVNEVPDRSPDKWFFVDGQWLHRPPFKVALNKILRLFQPWPRKLVIFSRCDGWLDDRPRCIGYGVGFVTHRSPEDAKL
jgi:hypothetical protein